MQITIKNPVSVVSVFIWLGFVLSISFMEAWLKFRAPGVTLPVGLSIGRVVFAALNKVEWCLLLVTLGSIIYQNNQTIHFSHFLIVAVCVVLSLQTWWLLPRLDIRAQLYISKQTLAPSSLHLVYVSLEIVKSFCLIGFGIFQFKINATCNSN